jgi:nicotinate-nucleotide adenylyltransferase
MKIAVCGGTFDPFHRGHLDPVLAVRNRMEWDRVIYVPAWRQPFKLEHESASGYHRFAMAVLATRDFDIVLVSPIELERGGTSYSVETLEAFHAMYPMAAFDWIIGDDHVTQLGQWKRIERVLQLARFVVLTRSGGETIPSSVRRDRIVFAENNSVPVSSTEIRSRVRAGESIDGLVDPLVSRYIHHYGLYKEAQT